ncbi:MAG: hypothetical protein ABI147_12355 [Acidobacteriaceae bacterium]
MKITASALIGGTFLVLAAQAFGQTSGTSHPEDLNDDITVVAPQNSTVTVTTPPPAQPASVYEQPIQPRVYQAPVRPAEADRTTFHAREEDPDANIVTSLPYTENALSSGTLLRARLVGPLSTDNTKPGSHFIATLTRNVEHNGRVIFPVGASLEGRVTEVRGGHRLGGAAAIHLEPETVTLPDGTLYRINAQIIDLDSGHNTRVNDEGTILGNDHTTGHVVTLAATTGGGAIAGAALGGGVGAAVGAGVGAGVGTVLWLRQDRQQTLPEGTELVFSLSRPMDLTPSLK